MGLRSYTHSFAGGEISPAMLGHFDDAGYRTGYADGLNMLVTPHGKLVRRPGFDFVALGKAGATAVRMLPFVYSSATDESDSYAMEWGPDYLRFHTDGAPVLYATPISIASFDTGTDRFTTTTAHGLTNNTPIRFTHEGTSFPGGVLSGTLYYVIVTSTTTFQVETSIGGGFVALTGSEAINETRVWRQSELPREYVTSRQATRNGNAIDCAAAHGLVDLDAVHFTTSNTLPGGLTVGTVYYVIVTDTDTFTLYPTKADADALTNQVTLSSAGFGTHTFHFAYYKGDVVWGGSLTLASSTSSRMFWCDTDLTTSLPNTLTGWHQMPETGVLELRHGVTAANLPLINYDQSFDRFAFTFQGGPPYELLREQADWPSGASTTVDVTRWVFKQVAREPSLEPPVMGSTTRNFGQRYTISIAAGPGTMDFACSGTTNHAILVGDILYMEGSLGVGSAMTNVSGTPGFFIVTAVTTNTFRCRNIEGGAEAQNSGGGIPTGAVRIAGASSRTSETYVVTSLKDDGDESVAGVETTVVNNLTVPGASNVLSWTAATGAVRYRVYRLLDEVYGMIGETESTTFTDDNIDPDFAISPPVYDDALSTDYPAATCHFQQRRYFGGTPERSQGVWGTRVGTFSTMTHHRPLVADDRISLDLVARDRSPIRHLVPMTHLIALTTTTEYRLTGTNEDTLTALSQAARPMSQVGASIVRPIVVNSSLLFVGDRDQHVYEIKPQQSQVLDPVDLSVRANHLFDGVTITESAQAKAPNPIEWFLTETGLLYGLTFMPGQNIAGWHVHDTDGTIESFCIVPEGAEDRIYASILRTVDGVETRMIERMGASQTSAALEDRQYLDCAVSYDGTATTTITGLDHLEGAENVYALADGVTAGPFTVTSGAITLDESASVVHAGLRNTAEVDTLPVALQIDGWGRGRELNIKRVAVRVESTARFEYGLVDGAMDYTHEFPNHTMHTGVVRLTPDGKWGQDVTLKFRQTDPLPLEIVALTIELEVTA